MSFDLLIKTAVAKESRDKASKILQDVLAGTSGIEEITYELTYRHRSRCEFIGETRMTPLLQPNGEIAGIQGITRDITERKRAAEALRREREFTRALVESISDALVACNEDGTLTLFNRTAREWHGMDALSLPAEQWAECYDLYGSDGATPLPTEAIPLMRAFRGEQVRSQAMSIVVKGGSIGVLAGGIAHDLNNYLTAILGHLSLAKLAATVDEKDVSLTAAENAARQGQGLSQQLLTFAKGGMPVVEPVDLGDLVIKSFNFSVRGTNVKCEFNLAENLCSVEIDIRQINQVFYNLLLNARQAMPDGGTTRISAENIVLDANSEIPLRPGTTVKLSVEDHGVGIAPEHIKRIFDPFFSAKKKGSGLGLATSHSIMQKHNGYITANSQLDVGTRVDIYLPVAKGELPVAEVQQEFDPKGVRVECW